MEQVTLELSFLAKGAEAEKIINGKKYIFKVIDVADLNEKCLDSDAHPPNEVIESLYGSWSDDESAEDIIARVKKNRKSSSILQID